jgi:acetyl-CoA synthetase (ADP-forming)
LAIAATQGYASCRRTIRQGIFVTDIETQLRDAQRAKRIALPEAAAKSILAAYGIAVPRSAIIATPDDAGAAVSELQSPFAAKLISPEASHKSDIGGVKINLASSEAVRVACREIAESAAAHDVAVEGFLVEEMAPPGTEVVIGGIIDDCFGPAVMFGLGGIFVELLEDVAFRLCPIEEIDAREMVDEIRASAVLKGTRGRPPVSEDAIVQALLRLGGKDGLFLAHAGLIREIDVNPLIVSSSGAVAADARIILAERQVSND